MGSVGIDHRLESSCAPMGQAVPPWTCRLESLGWDRPTIRSKRRDSVVGGGGHSVAPAMSDLQPQCPGLTQLLPWDFHLTTCSSKYIVLAICLDNFWEGFEDLDPKPHLTYWIRPISKDKLGPRSCENRAYFRKPGGAKPMLFSALTWGFCEPSEL